MTPENKTTFREVSISVVSIFVTAAIGVAGWGISDRLHWAAKEQQIDDTAQTVNDIKAKVDALPKDFVTRQEYDQIRQILEDQHAETMSGLGHLSDRIDNLARMDNIPLGALGSNSNPEASFSTMAKRK